jgi:tetratricopeptide (TPR) repeat protein
MMDTFRAYAEKFLGHYWGTALVILVVLCSLTFFLLGKKDEPPITTIRSHRYVFLLLTILVFAYPFYRDFIAPKINKPPKDRFVILVANFQPVSEDSKNAAKNFPDLLIDKLREINDPTIEVIHSNETVEGNTIEEEKENARKIGLRNKANLVIFGNVRCNEGMPGSYAHKYQFKPKMLLTEGPTYKNVIVSHVGFVGGRDYLDKSNYRDVSEIEQTVLSIVGLQKIASHDFEAAAKVFESIKDKDIEVYFEEAAALHILGRYNEAIAALDKVIELDPKFAAAYSNKGVELFILGKPEEALAAHDKAIEVDPKYADAYNGKGFVLDALRRYKEAIAAYDKAIELAPKNVFAYINKSMTLGKLGKYEEVIALCDKVIALDPKLAPPVYAFNYLAVAHANKGNALTGLRRYNEALAAYDKAIELDPKFAGAYYNKGLVLHELGREDEAQAAFQKARELGLTPAAKR